GPGGATGAGDTTLSSGSARRGAEVARSGAGRGGDTLVASGAAVLVSGAGTTDVTGGTAAARGGAGTTRAGAAMRAAARAAPVGTGAVATGRGAGRGMAALFCTRSSSDRRTESVRSGLTLALPAPSGSDAASRALRPTRRRNLSIPALFRHLARRSEENER